MVNQTLITTIKIVAIAAATGATGLVALLGGAWHLNNRQIARAQAHFTDIHVGMPESEVRSLIGRPFSNSYGRECLKDLKIDTSLESCKEKQIAFSYSPNGEVLLLAIDLQTSTVSEIEIVSYDRFD